MDIVAPRLPSIEEKSVGGGCTMNHPEKEAVVEIVQAKAAAARTSADDKTGTIAMKICAVTNRDSDEIARRIIVPDVTGTRTCTWPRPKSSSQSLMSSAAPWRARRRPHLPRGSDCLGRPVLRGGW